jgi:predicted nucleotide-binding protein
MKVFISHSHETKSLAKKLGEALKRAGLESWNHEQEILPGDNWAQKIAQALEESEAMVVLLSPDSLDSTLVRR